MFIEHITDFLLEVHQGTMLQRLRMEIWVIEIKVESSGLRYVFFLRGDKI